MPEAHDSMDGWEIIRRNALGKMWGQLMGSGWVEAGEQYPMLERTYPRVNDVLNDEAACQQAVHGAFDYFRQRSDIKGFALSTGGDDTELTIGVHGTHDGDEVYAVFLFNEYLAQQGFEEVNPSYLEQYWTAKAPDQPQVGTAEYYNQSPRAAMLREICMQGVRAYLDAVMAEGAQGEAAERLLDVNLQLSELNITPSMHEGRKTLDFMDPVVRIERIAGLLREMLRQGWGFRGQADAQFQEHDLSSGEAGHNRFIEITPGSPVNELLVTVTTLQDFARQLGMDPDGS